MQDALEDIATECAAISSRWGDQHHPTGAHRAYRPLMRLLQYLCDRAERHGRKTWRHILTEEVVEALAEPGDKVAMRSELVQAGAVIIWVAAVTGALVIAGTIAVVIAKYNSKLWRDWRSPSPRDHFW